MITFQNSKLLPCAAAFLFIEASALCNRFDLLVDGFPSTSLRAYYSILRQFAPGVAIKFQNRKSVSVDKLLFSTSVGISRPPDLALRSRSCQRVRKLD